MSSNATRCIAKFPHVIPGPLLPAVFLSGGLSSPASPVSPAFCCRVGTLFRVVSDVGPIPTAVASQLRPHRTMIFNLGFDASVQLPGQSSQGIQLHLRRREKGSYNPANKSQDCLGSRPA